MITPRLQSRGDYRPWLAGWRAWIAGREVSCTATPPPAFRSPDATLRVIGGAPTFALTDNERNVTVDLVAGASVRHPNIAVNPTARRERRQAEDTELATRYHVRLGTQGAA
jgi:hypothetical protein